MTRMAAMLAALVGGGGLLAAQAPAPAVIDLGTLGGPFAYATAINNRRQVLPLPPGSTTGNAVDISERGVAIGNYSTMPGETRALLWPKPSTRVPPRPRP